WTRDEVERWRRISTCVHCGAVLDESGWSAFGHRMSYGQTIREGVISRAIQVADRTRCFHRWESSMVSSRSMTGARGCGGGLDPGRYQLLSGLERDDRLAALCSRLQAGDKDLYDRLLAAIQASDNVDALEALYDAIESLPRSISTTRADASPP